MKTSFPSLYNPMYAGDRLFKWFVRRKRTRQTAVQFHRSAVRQEPPSGRNCGNATGRTIKESLLEAADCCARRAGFGLTSFLGWCWAPLGPATSSAAEKTSLTAHPRQMKDGRVKARLRISKQAGLSFIHVQHNQVAWLHCLRPEQ